MSSRGAAALLCATAFCVGCGGDEEPSDPEAQTAPGTTELGGSPTEAEPRGSAGDNGGGEGGGAPAAPSEPAPPAGGGNPEDQPGGAGDEIPARSEARITGQGGRLSPRLVRVPPFISVRVVLRSADGATYSLRGDGKRLSVGGGTASMSADFDGLRPGRRLTLGGPAGRVTVEASAEPGP